MGRKRATVFLIGFGATWNAGNVGPLVTELASEFDVTLGQVGLMSGSVFCVGVATAGYAGAWISERLTVIDGLRLCCAVCFAGNMLVAVSPDFAIALGARVLTGIGLGLAFLFGGAYAVVYEQGVRVLPDSPVGGLGFTQATANAFPIAVTPLLGAALAAGDGEAAWLAIGAFVLLGGALNAKPAVPPEPASATARS